MSQASPTGRNEGSAQRPSLQLSYLNLVPAAIVVAALYFGRPVLLPLAIGVLFAFALAPVVGWLRRIGLGRILSVLIAAVLAMGITTAIGMFITTRTIELVGELPRYQTNLIDKIRSVRGSAMEGGAVERASELLRTLRDQLVAKSGAPARTTVRPAPGQAAAPVQVQITEPETQPIELAAAFVLPFLEFLVAAGIVVVFVIFILLYKEDIRDRFIRLAGANDIQKTTLLLDEGAERLGQYLLTQLATNATFGLLIGCGLWLIGVPNPLLWGLEVVILRFIPFVGVPLAAVLPVLLALSVDPGWSMAIATAMLFIVGEIIFGQAVEPWLFGRRMGLSPLAIVVAITFWTWLWGPIGLLLSTPLTMCLMVLGRHVEHLQFLDVLLGDRAPLTAEESLYIRLLGDDADAAAVEAEGFLKENTLCRYYDAVVLRALTIGEADAQRGALDHDRMVKIKESTRALIENLADREPEDVAREDARDEALVLCVGGRGPLDEAAAMLLISLLDGEQIRARLATARDVSEAALHERELKVIGAVCVCYLDPANALRAPYLMRRIKHRFPGATRIAAFLGAEGSSAPAKNGYRVVTTLDAAVQAVTAALAEDTAACSARGQSEDTRESAARAKQEAMPAA